MLFGKSCRQCVVRDAALCAALTDSQLEPLARCGVQRSLARGETLVRAGDPAPICANIQSGLLKISQISPAGQEMIIGLLWPGDFIGTPFMGDAAPPAQHDIVALTPVSLCQFPQAIMERALADHPMMERQLLRRTFTALGDVRGRISRLARATAQARVAGFLLETAHRQGDDDGETMLIIELPLSRGEIADLLGLTIETVSRQIGKLKHAGVIGLPGGRRIAIHDPDALAEAAEAVI
ncbi:Crp/Fnr family transcriptional regulator [Sandarakinorhabdus oryzae]|uniref:Crp/Fnr family transcriptional regulator n=1 Tax=Sandarakinorhabdus oryzae TaxID=2675220 RepID=UPI0012E1F1AC|nr:Crp/Fnr family transcriptional regulator [Sandarakinorhabdus oryzae]